MCGSRVILFVLVCTVHHVVCLYAYVVRSCFSLRYVIVVKCARCPVKCYMACGKMCPVITVSRLSCMWSFFVGTNFSSKGDLLNWVFHPVGNTCKYRDDNYEISSPTGSRRIKRTASSSQYGERTGSGAQRKSFQRGQSGGYDTQQKGYFIALLCKVLVFLYIQQHINARTERPAGTRF